MTDSPYWIGPKSAFYTPAIAGGSIPCSIQGRGLCLEVSTLNFQLDSDGQQRLYRGVAHRLRFCFCKRCIAPLFRASTHYPLFSTHCLSLRAHEIDVRMVRLIL